MCTGWIAVLAVAQFVHFVWLLSFAYDHERFRRTLLEVDEAANDAKYLTQVLYDSTVKANT